MRFVSGILSILFLGSFLSGQGRDTAQDLQVAPTIRGVLIEMDSGNVLAKAPTEPPQHNGIRYTLLDGGRPLDLAAFAKTEGSTLVIRVPQGLSTAPIQMFVDVPKSLSLTIIGHSLSVKAEAFESPLTIRTFSGEIDVFNAVGPTSLESDSGAINVALRAQPKADFHLQTDSGVVTCTIDDGLSLKASIRSGKRISWGTGTETTSGGLDRSLGKGGPLIYASSRMNNVRVDLLASELASTGADAGVTFRSDTSWVYMNVAVKNQNNQSVPDLKQESFIVTDNGEPVELGHFEKTTEPFHLLLLFDTSASIKPHLGLIRKAATQFIQRARPGDEFAIAAFSTSSHLVQPFTSDLALAEKSLSALNPAGGTAIYDAVQKSVTDYMKEVAGRKAIVLFTDGVDFSITGSEFGSSTRFGALLRSVKDSDSLIYPIFVQPTRETRQVSSTPNAAPTNLEELLAKANGAKAQTFCVFESGPSTTPFPCDWDQIVGIGRQHLQQLAEETGGRFNGIGQMANLAEAYDRVAADLATVYTIGFPVKFVDNNQWHALKVRVREMPIGTQVRTRSGYFSPTAKQ